MPPLSGRVLLFGADLADTDADALRRRRVRCGVTVQGGSLLGALTVEENLWLGAGSAARARRRLDRLMLESFGGAQRRGGGRVAFAGRATAGRAGPRLRPRSGAGDPRQAAGWRARRRGGA
ncbi:hypothetical protein AB5I41_12145 [Sphingomonas sp. MMS24-JH45]